MGDSGNGGAGQSSKSEMDELKEMVLSLIAEQQKANKILQAFGKPLSIPSVKIRIVNNEGATGFVKIHDLDQTAEISISTTATVTFSNESDFLATLMMPIGPSGTIIELPLKPGKSLVLDFGRWIDSFINFLTFTGNPHWRFTVQYYVEPSGNGGGPNLIVRP